MEASKEELEALLARVESATGPDREIDLALMILGWGGPRERYLTDELDRLAFGEQWKFTASLDAALALVERVLPGRDIDLELREGMQDGQVHRFTDATIYAQAYSDDKRDFKAFGNSPALALLTALLRAKAKDAQPHGTPQAIDTGVK